MASPKVISLEFLLWSQSLLLWSYASYGTVADPLQEDVPQLRWKTWALFLALRALLATGLAYLISSSVSLSCFLLVLLLLQPVLRYCLPMRWLAGFESLGILVFVVLSLAVIRHFQLASQCAPASIPTPQLAALCILASTLLIVVRGGTYIVRGVLRTSGTLPRKKGRNSNPRESASVFHPETPAPAAIAATADPTEPTIDFEEYNRGRLIGNLERIVLTIVVAGGSYAALAFLVAAKGVVRSDEFEHNTDFTEYFLIGSLSSVLVALCAGLALRFALIRLWPDLLTLQMH